MKSFTLNQKILIPDNYYQIKNIYLGGDLLIALTDFTTILYSLKNGKSNIIDKISKFVVFNDSFNEFCLVENKDILSEQIITIYNSNTYERIHSLIVNLEKCQNIMNVCFYNTKILITMSNGIIYNYDYKCKLMNTEITSNDSNFINSYFSKDNKYLILSYTNKIVLINEMDKTCLCYPKNNKNLNLSGNIAISKDNNLISIINNNKVLILKIFDNNNIEKVCIIDIPDKNKILSMKFNPKINHILLINTNFMSYLYYIEKTDSSFVYHIHLIDKLNNADYEFSLKDSLIISAKNRSINIYNCNNLYDNYIINIIDLKKDKFQKKIDVLNYNNNLNLFEQKLLPYDFVLKCDDVDYQKRVHSFILYSKLPILNNTHYFSDGFFNIESNNTNPDLEAIDEFLKYLYTDELPDTKTIINNIKFYEFISKYLWNNNDNNLSNWIKHIQSIGHQNNLF